ncbi:MAG: ABC transporter transmembrane domain-containing protein [Trueperaceae bacterium]|nr:ABC transporter transmembrane domain-containing protein [Trueperaceae bacterium]
MSSSRARPSRRSSGERASVGWADLRQLRRLFTFTKPYRVQLAVGIFAVSVASGLGLLFPFITRELFNTAFLEADENLAQLDLIALGLFGIFAVQAGFNYLRVYYLAVAGEGVVADLRTTLFGHLVYLPVRFFEERKTGEITSRLTADIATVQGVVSQSLAQFVNQLITLVGGVIFLFFLSLELTLLMLSIVPAVIIAGAYFGRKLRTISTEFQDKVADANASAEEAISGIRVVKSFTGEGLEYRRYSDQIGDAYQLALRRGRVRAIFIPSIILAMFSAVTAVLWYGGRLVASDQLLAGDLIAFLLLTVFVAGSIGTFTGLYSQFQEALGASQRIFELLDEQGDLSEAPGARGLEHPQGDLRFEHVSFRYGDRGDEYVLKDISLRAAPGEIIALVGPSGAGKSTLVTLIPRFYDPTEGRILLDGYDLRDLALHDLRAHIGIVPQETQLFSGSIAENIGYGRPGAPLDEIIDAATAANAHDFIRGFPDGYDTVVGERGVKLSGGQRQRVAIARALLKNPKILILDEATSSLDSESEALVQAALDRLMEGRTTFVIAHRLSTVQNASRILVLEHGRIVETGSHDSLVAKGGLYHDLYARQFSHEVLSD